MQLPVYAPIPVRCAFTGNEVITFGLPDPGQVRDAFGGFVEHAVAAAGCEVRPLARLADVESEFSTFLTDLHRAHPGVYGRLEHLGRGYGA